MPGCLDIPFLWIAHRGAMAYNPQNSLAAFNYCVENGLTWIETDIRLTKNGVPVLFHDELTSSQQHNASVPLHSLSYSELASLDIGNGERVPTLRQLFELYGATLCFDIELKEIDSADSVARLIKEFGLQERLFITSFIPDALQRTSKLLPEVPHGLLIDRMTGNLARGKHTVTAASLLGCSYILPDYRLVDKDLVTAAHNEGVKVVVWTVNERDDAENLIGLGVDGIISDRPDWLIVG